LLEQVGIMIKELGVKENVCEYNLKLLNQILGFNVINGVNTFSKWQLLASQMRRNGLENRD
jgi:predicted peroxiredoxin